MRSAEDDCPFPFLLGIIGGLIPVLTIKEVF